MAKIKVFFISFIVTLAAILPIYGIAYFLNVARPRAQFANEPQTEVYISQPAANETISILLMVGDENVQNTQSYVIVNFNAYENSINVVSMPGETVMIIDGKPITLEQATKSAGPSQAASAISQTLGISVEKYVFVSAELLWQTAQAFGNISMRTSLYASEESLKELGVIINGNEPQVLSPRFFAQILSDAQFSNVSRYEMRALGYSLFFSAGYGRLSEVLSEFFEENSAKIATNISAVELNEYKRIWQFLDRQQPTYNAGTLPGEYSNFEEQVYELNEQSLEFINKIF